MSQLLLATAFLVFAGSQAVDEARSFGIAIGRAGVCEIDRNKVRDYKSRAKAYLDSIAIDFEDRGQADEAMDQGIDAGRADQEQNQTHPCDSVEFILGQ